MSYDKNDITSYIKKNAVNESQQPTNSFVDVLSHVLNGEMKSVIIDDKVIDVPDIVADLSNELESTFDQKNITYMQQSNGVEIPSILLINPPISSEKIKQIEELLIKNGFSLGRAKMKNERDGKVFYSTMYVEFLKLPKEIKEAKEIVFSPGDYDENVPKIYELMKKKLEVLNQNTKETITNCIFEFRKAMAYTFVTKEKFMVDGPSVFDIDEETIGTKEADLKHGPIEFYRTSNNQYMTNVLVGKNKFGQTKQYILAKIRVYKYRVTKEDGRIEIKSDLPLHITDTLRRYKGMYFPGFDIMVANDISQLIQSNACPVPEETLRDFADEVNTYDDEAKELYEKRYGHSMNNRKCKPAVFNNYTKELQKIGVDPELHAMNTIYIVCTGVKIRPGVYVIYHDEAREFKQNIYKANYASVEIHFADKTPTKIYVNVPLFNEPFIFNIKKGEWNKKPQFGNVELTRREQEPLSTLASAIAHAVRTFAPNAGQVHKSWWRYLRNNRNKRK